MAFLINDLLIPEAFPEKTKEVSLVQTHISWVLLTDNFAYKIKKSVNLGFLDFSTLLKRRYYCNQEINLNKRLSRDIYIGVVPVYFDGRRHKIGEGSGDVVEYTVKMKRIPDSSLMLSMFETGRLQQEHIRRLAELLATFHSTAQRSVDIDNFGSPDVFKINTDENFFQTEPYIGRTIKREEFESIKDWTNNFYIENRELFFDRISGGKIKDCHGDLHMEHICLTDPVSVFDCIEFNERFRYTDILADIAFILMDLEYRGGEVFARILWDYYNELTGDDNPDSLLTFYKVYRAYVRGKVNTFRIDDAQTTSEKKEEVIHIARKYFQLARNYIL
jgi:aminoglycoside phosphotransferase family enzyme